MIPGIVTLNVVACQALMPQREIGAENWFQRVWSPRKPAT